jgi:hypothetical protein
MCKKMYKCTFRKGFTEIKIINNDISIGYDPRHLYKYIIKNTLHKLYSKYRGKFNKTVYNNLS